MHLGIRVSTDHASHLPPGTRMETCSRMRQLVDDCACAVAGPGARASTGASARLSWRSSLRALDFVSWRISESRQGYPSLPLFYLSVWEQSAIRRHSVVLLLFQPRLVLRDHGYGARLSRSGLEGH